MERATELEPDHEQLREAFHYLREMPILRRRTSLALHNTVRDGESLSDDEVARLETRLEGNPDDVTERIRLLGYYSTRAWQKKDGISSEHHARHRISRDCELRIRDIEGVWVPDCAHHDDLSEHGSRAPPRIAGPREGVRLELFPRGQSRDPEQVLRERWLQFDLVDKEHGRRLLHQVEHRGLGWNPGVAEVADLLCGGGHHFDLKAVVVPIADAERDVVLHLEQAAHVDHRSTVLGYRRRGRRLASRAKTSSLSAS